MANPINPHKHACQVTELGSMVEVSRYAASLINSISLVPTTDEPLNGGGRHLTLGGKRFVCVRKHTHARGVWGTLPHENFAN